MPQALATLISYILIGITPALAQATTSDTLGGIPRASAAWKNSPSCLVPVKCRKVRVTGGPEPALLTLEAIRAAAAVEAAS